MLLLTVVVSIEAAFAQGAQPPPKSSGTLSMRGTIERYETASGLLSLSTAGKTVQLHTTPATRIRRGRPRISAGELEQLTGFRVAVRYSESGTNKVIASIRVFDEREKTK